MTYQVSLSSLYMHHKTSQEHRQDTVSCLSNHNLQRCSFKMTVSQVESYIELLFGIAKLLFSQYVYWQSLLANTIWLNLLYDDRTDFCKAVQLVFVAAWLSICTVYAKCKLLFATLTHLQSNSRSVVVRELPSLFYGSLVKKKKSMSVRFACMTTEFLVFLNNINVRKSCSASHLIQTTWDAWCVTQLGWTSDVHAEWFKLHTDAFVIHLSVAWVLALL